MASLNSREHLQDEAAAYAWIEAHLWPAGPECAHCGGTEKITKLMGKATRFGLYKCNPCRKQFRVTMGTIFEKSHVPLHMWLQAFYMLASGKKGVSSNEIHRVLGVTIKTAWFMTHRIREAMRTGSLMPPMGGDGGVVEADETFIGDNKLYRNFKGNRGYHHKHVVLTLVDRAGQARSFHVDRADAQSILPIVKANIDKEATIYTDDANYYRPLGKDGRKHESVKHARGEWARGEIHTNTVEGFFSVFKRGMKGVYQHCSEKHLHRYLAEFDFRYSNRKALGIEDEERATRMVKGVKGKRLTYRTTGGA